MRRIAVGTVVGAVALAAAVPAAARTIDLGGSVRVSGSVAVSWHGDPSRGCARRGLCGYTGALTSRPSAGGQILLTFARDRLAGGFSFLEPAEPAVIRVTRAEEGRDVTGCVDLGGLDDLGVFFVPAGRDRVRVVIEGSGLSTGRCAGPPIGAAVARLPSRTVSLARLRRGRATVDLSATIPYGAGGFSGTVLSTVRMHIGRLRAQAGGRQSRPPSRRAARRLRVVTVRARYALTRLTGKLSTVFQGPPGLACEVLDACGVAGAATWAVIANDGFVVAEARAVARGSDRGLRGALAALARGPADLAGLGETEHSAGTTTAELTRPGGGACHDAARLHPPGIAAGLRGRRITVELGGEHALFSTGDLLRTGCPGPTERDVLGAGPLASGSLPLSALARRRLELRLERGGRFGSERYSGTRRASFTLGLERVAVRVSYKHVRVRR